jgi:hypothetical protein
VRAAPVMFALLIGDLSVFACVCFKQSHPVGGLAGGTYTREAPRAIKITVQFCCLSFIWPAGGRDRNVVLSSQH